MFAYPNPQTETVYLKVTIFEAHVLLPGFACERDLKPLWRAVSVTGWFLVDRRRIHVKDKRVQKYSYSYSCGRSLRPSFDGSGQIFERTNFLFTSANRLHETVQILLQIAVLFVIQQSDSHMNLFLPEKFLEINRYFTLTSYCNTIA